MTDYDPDEAEENRIKGIGKPEPKTPDTKPEEGLGEAINCTCLGPGHADRCKIKTLRAECDALKQRVNELEAELEKWRDHLCGGVPEYRDFGTTGMVMDQRGNLWKKT